MGHFYVLYNVALIVTLQGLNVNVSAVVSVTACSILRAALLQRETNGKDVPTRAAFKGKTGVLLWRSCRWGQQCVAHHFGAGIKSGIVLHEHCGMNTDSSKVFL